MKDASPLRRFDLSEKILEFSVAVCSCPRSTAEEAECVENKMNKWRNSVGIFPAQRNSKDILSPSFINTIQRKP